VRRSAEPVNARALALYYRCKTRQFKARPAVERYLSLTIALNASLTLYPLDRRPKREKVWDRHVQIPQEAVA
jgi:hypothetical protein